MVMRRQQDRPQTKLRIAQRRARLVELFGQGLSYRKAAAVLEKEGFEHSLCTVHRDLHALSRQATGNIATNRATAEHQLRVLSHFVVTEAELSDKETVDSLLQIHDRIAKLLGLNLERASTHVQVNIEEDPTKMMGYKKFLHETRFVSESKFPEIWALCRSLSEPPTAETTARIVPPEDSPLWHDGDDEPLMIEGKVEP